MRLADARVFFFAHARPKISGNLFHLKARETLFCAIVPTIAATDGEPWARDR